MTPSPRSSVCPSLRQIVGAEVFLSARACVSRSSERPVRPSRLSPGPCDRPSVATHSVFSPCAPLRDPIRLSLALRVLHRPTPTLTPAGRPLDPVLPEPRPRPTLAAPCRSSRLSALPRSPGQAARRASPPAPGSLEARLARRLLLAVSSFGLKSLSRSLHPSLGWAWLQSPPSPLLPHPSTPLRPPPRVAPARCGLHPPPTQMPLALWGLCQVRGGRGESSWLVSERQKESTIGTAPTSPIPSLLGHRRAPLSPPLNLVRRICCECVGGSPSLTPTLYAWTLSPCAKSLVSGCVGMSCVCVSFCAVTVGLACACVSFFACVACLCVCVYVCLCPEALCVSFATVCTILGVFVVTRLVCVCVLVCQCVCPCVSGDFSVAYWVYHGDQLATSTLDLLIVEAPGVGCLPTRLMCECICMNVCMCVYSCVALPLPLSFCDQAHLVTKGGD